MAPTDELSAALCVVGRRLCKLRAEIAERRGAGDDGDAVTRNWIASKLNNAAKDAA
jgi:hypothetical protein